MKPTIGKMAPLFSAPSTTGEPIHLVQCRGYSVVLYFYPKDDTPGCTLESQDFQAMYPAFRDAKCIVLGISRDSLQSHQKFGEKYALEFPLIADPDETVCNLFGVLKEKNMSGKRIRGIERSTFLINAYGTLIQEWRSVKVPGHVKEVLAAAQSIG